jgi:hypothetical protein
MFEPAESSDSSVSDQGQATDLAGLLLRIQQELDQDGDDDGDCAFDLLFGLDH